MWSSWHRSVQGWKLTVSTRIGEVNPCLKYSIKVLLGCLFLLLFTVFFRFICAIHWLYGVFFNLFLHLDFMILRNLTAAHAIFVWLSDLDMCLSVTLPNIRVFNGFRFYSRNWHNISISFINLRGRQSWQNEFKNIYSVIALFVYDNTIKPECFGQYARCEWNTIENSENINNNNHINDCVRNM